MKIFDFEQWALSFLELDNARKFDTEETLNLAQFSFKHEFIAQDGQNFAKKHWPLFRGKMKPRQGPIIDVYNEFVCRKCDDVRGDTVLLKIMITISSNSAFCERSLSCMNRKKSDFLFIYLFFL